MINISSFQDFLKLTFDAKDLYIYSFKPDLQFAEIDCFKKQSYKLSVEITEEDIKLSAIEKNATLDFSLHEYIFNNNEEAEDFIKDLCIKGYYVSPK